MSETKQPSCYVCDLDPELQDKIEADIAAGVKWVDLESNYGIPDPTLRRHQAHRNAEALATRKTNVPVPQGPQKTRGTKLVKMVPKQVARYTEMHPQEADAELFSLMINTAKLAEEMASSGDSRGALQAISEMHKLVVSRNKIISEFRGGLPSEKAGSGWTDDYADKIEAQLLKIEQASKGELTTGYIDEDDEDDYDE